MVVVVVVVVVVRVAWSTAKAVCGRDTEGWRHALRARSHMASIAMLVLATTPDIMLS